MAPVEVTVMHSEQFSFQGSARLDTSPGELGGVSTEAPSGSPRRLPAQRATTGMAGSREGAGLDECGLDAREGGRVGSSRSAPDRLVFDDPVDASANLAAFIGKALGSPEPEESKEHVQGGAILASPAPGLPREPLTVDGQTQMEHILFLHEAFLADWECRGYGIRHATVPDSAPKDEIFLAERHAREYLEKVRAEEDSKQAAGVNYDRQTEPNEGQSMDIDINPDLPVKTRDKLRLLSNEFPIVSDRPGLAKDYEVTVEIKPGATPHAAAPRNRGRRARGKLSIT